MISLSEFRLPHGAIKKRKRLGRGDASGHGSTSSRGQKGQKARAGGNISPYFEGGQMPLYRRLPKRGFKNIFRKEYDIVNVDDLVKRFKAGDIVDLKALKERGLINKGPVKLLGNGEINFPLTVKVHKSSKQARGKVEAAGGKVEAV
jgi:large subunit ribosomal protein L15